jgi:hypothetical protein
MAGHHFYLECISVREALWSTSSQTAACSQQCLPRDLYQKINLTTGDRIERNETSSLRNAWAAGATMPRRKMAKQSIPPDLAWRLLAQIVGVSMLKTIVGIIGSDRSVAR